MKNIKNKVSRDNYARNDFVKKIEWLSAKDSFVRGTDPHDQFDHVSADGQRVEIGRKFNVSGEPLAYPGDKSASAGNVINCRCTTIPVILD